MDKVSTYQAYQNRYYDTALQKRKNREADRAEQKNKINFGNQPKLSEKARALLEELKKTYGNMDFFVADYETDEEAAAYLSRGTKEYSVLIDTDTLEQMAADDATKEKYLGILDDAKGQLKDMKEELEANGESVKNIGITIKDDGSVSYFANLEKNSEQQRERIEEAKKENQEKAAEEEKRAGGRRGRYDGYVQRTTVHANSIEELMDKIRNVDWSKIKPEGIPVAEGRFEAWM